LTIYRFVLRRARNYQLDGSVSHVHDEATPITELLDRARTGDSDALEQLFSRYRLFVHLLIRQRSAGRLQARVENSDIVQETLLRAARHIAQFQGTCEEEWRAWLGRIAEREVVKQLRHHFGAARRDATREQPLLLGGSGSTNDHAKLEQWLARSQSSPSGVAIRKERALLLADALARLPPDYREVLVLRHLEGLDFAEVAIRLNRSAGAARVLWTRALKKLREELARVNALDSDLPHV
jgi:RNA polymerase sigma-70 factor (ECF subfamily)